MLMSDVQIQEALDLGEIGITPFDRKMLQPASYDLKVGRNAATVPTNGDPRINLEKEGVLFIPAYAPAVIWTREELRLSKSYVGHFGLKSKLARRGLSASVGIQVDPGFCGPLSVTLMNMTPSPVSLSYEDDFLTLEFEKLSVPASRGYSGEYQGRKTFSAQELDSVMGFRGHALTDVVKGFDDVRDAVRGVAEMSNKLDTFMEQHRAEIRSSQKFNTEILAEMKKLVGYIVEQRPTTVVLRAIPRDLAKSEILSLFKKSKRTLFYSDVAERLSLNLELVVELCNELESEGRIGVLSHHEAKRSQAKRQ